MHLPLLALLAGLSVTLQAQQVVLTKTADVRLRAEQFNPNLKALALQDEMAQRDAQSQYSTYLPTVNLQANSDDNYKLPVQLIPLSFFGGPAGMYQEVRFGRPWNSTATFDASQPLLHADKFAQIKAASHSRNQTRYEVQQQKIALFQQIDQLYFQCLALQENLKLQYSLDSTAKALYDNTRMRYEQQLVSRLDLNRVENLMLQNHQQYLSMKASLDVAMKNLGMLLGLKDTETLLIRDSIGNYGKTTENTGLLSDSRMKVLAAQENVLAAQWRLRQQSWSRYPKLSFGTRYTFASQGDTWLGAGSNNFEYGSIGFSLSMPLFKGLSGYQNTRKARLQWKVAQFQEENIRLQSSKELQEWQIRLKEKQETALLAGKRAQMTADNLNMGTKSYTEGVMSLSDLFNLYNEHTQAHSAYVQAVTDAAWYQNVLETEKLKR